MPPEMTRAAGTFDVKTALTNHPPDPTIGSMSLDKQYHGDLEATAKGEMLWVGDPASGNAGSVAIERVRGTLGGKTGSFAFMLSGVMVKGTAPQMTVTIIPGSGTEELSGIQGTLTIIITAGKHSYTLDYAYSAQ